jgi:predicted nucleic acid-binding protein
VDRLFLDANVLFSAAYREDAGVRRLWDLPEAELVTSAYAVEEARRNLDTGERRSDLGGLFEAVRVSNLLADPTAYPEIESSGLPEKDLPILRAAVASAATYLVTGDRKHFGHLFGQVVAGVLVLRPAELLAMRTEEPRDDAPGDGLPVEGEIDAWGLRGRATGT